MFTAASPTLEATRLPAGHAPPSPPRSIQSDDPDSRDALDDIYGSSPPSPSSHHLSHAHNSHTLSSQHQHEILSDLPSRQRALDTDAYREGLAENKGQYVQAGFDEGFSLGANLGLRVGYILGILQGLTGGMKGQDSPRYEQVRGWWEDAQRELGIQELLGREWEIGRAHV